MSLTKKSDVKQRLEEVILGMSSARSDMIQRHSRQGSLTGKYVPTTIIFLKDLLDPSHTKACDCAQTAVHFSIKIDAVTPGGYSDLVWIWENHFPFVRVILAEKGTYFRDFSLNIGPIFIMDYCGTPVKFSLAVQ